MELITTPPLLTSVNHGAVRSADQITAVELAAVTIDFGAPENAESHKKVVARSSLGCLSSIRHTISRPHSLTCHELAAAAADWVCNAVGTSTSEGKVGGNPSRPPSSIIGQALRLRWRDVLAEERGNARARAREKKAEAQKFCRAR